MNNILQQSQTSVTTSYVRGGGMRGRGRGRGGNAGVTRREYSSRQQNTQTQEVQQQPVVDQQSMLQHGNFIYYPYFTPQHMQVGMPTAQHATGSLTGQPLYASNNMMPTTYIPAHQLYGYPMYPSMVPPEYSMIEGKVDESPENQMHQMWHHIPIEYADHQQIEHAMHPQHPEEFMQPEDMDEYNYNQNIDHNSPHAMLSPMYKEDQQYQQHQQLHLSPEYVQNVPQQLVHLSPQHQQIIEVQSQQQQQQHQQQIVVMNQQQHQQTFNEALSGNEFSEATNQHENNAVSSTATITNQHENNYHTSIDSFNNNIEEKATPLIENLKPKIMPSEGVKVPVVTTINNNSLKGSNSNSNISSGSGSGSSVGGGDNKSVESTSVVPKPIQQNSVQTQPPVVISTADLNKLATSVNEKLIIKSDRAPSKQSSSHGPWNKKNTTSVAVSAVPISYPPPPFQATNTRNTDTSTTTNHKPTVPKSDNILTKETKEVDASSEQSQKSVSVNTSTSNSHQSSIESRSVKVEVIPRPDNNALIVNSSDILVSVTKSNVKDESVQSQPSQIQSTAIAPNHESSISAPPVAPSTWAGLFAAKPGYATRTHSDPISRKPVAKVSPFETSLNSAPQNNFTTEGQLSYSAASSQGLPTPSSNVSLGTGAHKKTVSKATVAPSKSTTTPHGDESLKMGGKC